MSTLQWLQPENPLLGFQDRGMQCLFMNSHNFFHWKGGVAEVSKDSSVYCWYRQLKFSLYDGDDDGDKGDFGKLGKGYHKDLWWWPTAKSSIAPVRSCTFNDFGRSIWGFWNGGGNVWWVRDGREGPIFWRGIFILIIQWRFFKAPRYWINAMIL